MSLLLKRKLEGAMSGVLDAAKKKQQTINLDQVDKSHDEPQNSNTGLMS
jgi:hypothetical protein